MRNLEEAYSAKWLLDNRPILLPHTLHPVRCTVSDPHIGITVKTDRDPRFAYDALFFVYTLCTELLRAMTHNYFLPEHCPFSRD